MRNACILASFQVCKYAFAEILRFLKLLQIRFQVRKLRKLSQALASFRKLSQAFAQIRKHGFAVFRSISHCKLLQFMVQVASFSKLSQAFASFRKLSQAFASFRKWTFARILKSENPSHGFSQWALCRWAGRSELGMRAQVLRTISESCSE